MLVYVAYLDRTTEFVSLDIAKWYSNKSDIAENIIDMVTDDERITSALRAAIDRY